MQWLKLVRYPVLLALMLILVAGGSLPTDAQTAEPTSVAPAPTFRILHMVSPTNGWAVATLPNPQSTSDAAPGMIYPGTRAYILHTNDGGKTWADVSPFTTRPLLPAGGYGCDCSDNGLTNAFFLDDQHAWVMTDDASIPGNQLFDGIGIHSTSDGGQTWKESVEGLNGPFVIASSFVDAAHGWLLVGGIPSNDGDEPAMLYSTVDGGMTWKLIADDGKHTHSPSSGDSGDPISTPATGVTAMPHQGMVFESASSGWIISMDFDPGDSAVLHTTDGGMTWKNVPITSATGSTQDMTNCPVWELHVFAPGEVTILAVCHDGKAVLYHSADDGATWQENPLPPLVFNLSQPKALFMLNATMMWSIGCPTGMSDCVNPRKSNTVYGTKDGGNRWDMVGRLPIAFRMISTTASVSGPQFDFISDQIGWAIDPAGILYTTKNGGKGWDPIQPSIQLP